MNETIKTDLGNKEVFSRNLSRYVEMSKKSRREIAKDLGISPSTFADWVNGRVYPRMNKVQRLAEYFGINKAELVEDVYVAKETISKEDQEVLDLFHQVKKEKREFLISLIRASIDNL